jgi:hypothetical protein
MSDMGAHVFVVDKYSYHVHANKGFCGVKNPKGGGRLGLIADIKAYRVRDTVFFYHRRIDERPLERGFRDVFEIISEPFYDETDVRYRDWVVYGKCPHCGTSYSDEMEKGTMYCLECKKELDGHILPFRVLIKPVMRFERPVDDNTAYIDYEDPGELHTLRWRKVTGAGRARSAQHILPEEATKIIGLLKKINDDRQSGARTENYISVQQASNKKLPPTLEITRSSGEALYYVKRNGSFSDESGLPAWFNENIGEGTNKTLDQLVGPLHELEYFGNNVPYGVGGENADLLLLHKKNGKRFKATIFELKKDEITDSTVNQVLDPEWQNYAKWVGQLATAYVEPPVDSLEIQPILVGFGINTSAKRRIGELEKRYNLFSRKTRIRYRHRDEVIVRVKEPILVSYLVRNNTVNLTTEK